MGFFLIFCKFQEILDFLYFVQILQDEAHLKKSIIFKILNFYYLILVNDMQMQNRIGRNR